MDVCIGVFGGNLEDGLIIMQDRRCPDVFITLLTLEGRGQIGITSVLSFKFQTLKNDLHIIIISGYSSIQRKYINNIGTLCPGKC